MKTRFKACCNHSILYIIFFFVLLPINSALCQVGEVSDVEIFTLGEINGQGIVSLRYSNNDLGRVYFLMYENEGTPNKVDVKLISFLADEKELEKLYKFLMDGFEREQLTKIEVGEGWIYTSKETNSKRINIHSILLEENTGYFSINKRQLKRLFGKR